MTDEHNYHVMYDVRHSKEGVKAADRGEWGLCDHVVVLSINGALDKLEGSTSVALLSINGITGEAFNAESLWAIWIMLAGILQDGLREGSFARATCDAVLSEVQERMAPGGGQDG